MFKEIAKIIVSIVWRTVISLLFRHIQIWITIPLHYLLSCVFWCSQSFTYKLYSLFCNVVNNICYKGLNLDLNKIKYMRQRVGVKNIASIIAGFSSDFNSNSKQVLIFLQKIKNVLNFPNISEWPQLKWSYKVNMRLEKIHGKKRSIQRKDSFK